MTNVSLPELQTFVSEHIGEFHQARLESLKTLKLKTVLKRKNPYLFRAKNIVLAQDLVRLLLDAHPSSQEEGLFGHFMEKVAIQVCAYTYGGYKSARPSIDLEFEREGVFYLVSIKSGPNWGNADQIRKMRDNFALARQAIQADRPGQTVVAVNGCCYGQEKVADKGDYQKLCGQAFWRFISGVDDLYLQLIKPMGHQARQRNAAFMRAYAQLINLFTAEFFAEFCTTNGAIDWEKLVRFNSSP